MRIVAAVVVAGAVMLASAHGASAAEPKRQRSEKCLEICNFTFEQCQKDMGPKLSDRCNIEVVRCKGACPFETVEEPAIPTAVSNQRCLDACRDTYQKCLRRPENKRGGSCAADDVRCEQACPKPPEPVVAEVPAAGGAPGAAPAAVPAKKKKVKRGRVEGFAAPAPIEPTPTPNRPAPAAEGPAGTVPARGEAVAPAAVAPAAAAPAPAAPAVAAPAAAARPAPEERGFWATLGCFFVACDPPGTTPCLQQCGDAYDQCRVRESKRGGECNTRLMNCRKDCSAAAR